MKIFKIHEGKHYSGLHFHPTINKHKLVSEITFDESCLYDLHSNDNHDINKLLGFSQGYHHNNSARLGWRCLDGKTIQLLTYCYVDKVRIPEILLATVTPDETFRFTLRIAPSSYYFKIETLTNINTVNIPRSKTTCIGYMLYPYFGGNQPAPHDMEIKICIE